MAFRTQPWRLAPGVHAASLNGDLVFLDVGRDAYICLPDASGDVRLTCDRRGLAAPSDLLDELQRAGLAEPGPPTDADKLIAWAPPMRSALQDQFPGPTMGDAVQVALSLTDVALGYHRRPLAHIVEDAARRPEVPAEATPELLAIVARFHRWSPYAPVSGKCLLRSYMLLKVLRRHGFDATWVFAVRTWPFDAHCWLQCGDVALDEQPDRIKSYTPIMVV